VHDAPVSPRGGWQITKQQASLATQKLVLYPSMVAGEHTTTNTTFVGL
jgi:hypothetical protein